MTPERTTHEPTRPLVGNWPHTHARLWPAPQGAVRLGGLLGARVDAVAASLLAGLESPIPRRFQALARGEAPGPETNRLAADSDLCKWIEGASYALAYTGDGALREALERMTALVLAQQAPDGYINTQVPPYQRFDTRVNHDLYQAGHFFEAAVAHHAATGEGALLEAAGRWADYLLRQARAGHPYFRALGEREHPEVELGLVRLYRATGREAYLRFAEEIAAESRVTTSVRALRAGAGARHAVRVGYLLAALAELTLEAGDAARLETLRALWEELAATRTYVTGGLGYAERIPELPYDLPQSLEANPDRDIAETCASVALMMFTWRLHALKGESRYYDLIETILYNHYLGALSPDVQATFYYNPLRVVGDQTGRTDHGGRRDRRTRLPEIHSTACCLPNAWRFLGALPEYVCSLDDEGVLVNLLSEATLRTTAPDGTPLVLDIATRYPHDGDVRVTLTPERPTRLKVHLRVPAWCAGASLTDPEGRVAPVAGGAYAAVERVWRAGEAVTLRLPMAPRLLRARPEVLACAGQVALARGPLVYCLEGADAPVSVERVRLAADPRPAAVWQADLLGGLYALEADALVDPAPPEGGAYYEAALTAAPARVRLIPFYARANRGEGARWVTWLPWSAP